MAIGLHEENERHGLVCNTKRRATDSTLTIHTVVPLQLEFLQILCTVPQTLVRVADLLSMFF